MEAMEIGKETINNIYLNNFWEGKKVLVTGHTGFKGSWLTLWLDKLGAEILGYALEPDNEKSLFNQLNLKNKCTNKIENILDKKKPVIFVSGHFSNFELMSMEITKNNIPLATIYRPLNNFFINPFMEYLRKKYVCEKQIKKGINGVRESIECIKKGQSIALMIDQRVSEGIRVDFFGKPALTTSLPAQLAIKFDLPIIPVFIERETNYNYKIKFFNPIKNSNSENKEEITKKLNQVLESMILKNPNEWIWTHNRWK